MTIPIKKILVTGSSGMIGTALMEKLMETRGYDLVGADIRPNEWSSAINKCTVRVDLTQRAAIEALLPREVECIIHLAAHSRVWDVIASPRLAEENIAMLANIAEFARAHHIPRIIFASSREVYGNIVREAYHEDNASIDACESPYAMSKLAGEALLRAYHTCYGVDSVLLRFANVYGKYDITNRVIPLFIAHCHSGKAINIFGKDKVLDFTSIDDTVHGIMLALDNFETIKNEVYNIASGIGTSLVELARHIQTQMGTDVPITIEDNRTGEVMRYVGAIDKARTAFGYSPQVSLDEGLKSATAWYRHFYTTHPDRIPVLRD